MRAHKQASHVAAPAWPEQLKAIHSRGSATRHCARLRAHTRMVSAEKDEVVEHEVRRALKEGTHVRIHRDVSSQLGGAQQIRRGHRKRLLTSYKRLK